MTKPEVSFLLTAIFVFERRPDGVSPMEVEAWFQLLSDVSFDDAKEVVKAHFSESDRPLSPAKIRAGVRALAAQRRPPVTVEDKMRVPDADPDDAKAFIAALKGRRWQPYRQPEDFPLRELDVSSLGRQVPDVTKEEIDDDGPRPRRWWMKWSKGQSPPGEGT